MSLRTDVRSGGVQMLDKMGLYEKCKEVSVTHAGNMHIWNRTFSNSLLRLSVGPVGEKGLMAMRIRRNALQKVLAEQAKECGWEIVWGKGVVDAEKKDTKMQVELSDGEKVDCDLLVAADGSSSKVRQMLRPNDKLDYAGVVQITGTGKFEREADVPKPMNRDWGLVVGGGGTGVFVSPVERNSALWAFSYYSKDPKAPLRHPMAEDQQNELLAEAKALAMKYDPEMMTLVEATDPMTLMRLNTQDRPPFKHEPAKDGAVVWLGDANHAVSPFAGNGANMAIIDGWDLAQVLSHAETLEVALAGYDRKFMPRAKATLTMSRWSINIAHSSGIKFWLYTLILKVLRFFFVRGKA